MSSPKRRRVDDESPRKLALEDIPPDVILEILHFWFRVWFSAWDRTEYRAVLSTHRIMRGKPRFRSSTVPPTQEGAYVRLHDGAMHKVSVFRTVDECRRRLFGRFKGYPGRRFFPLFGAVWFLGDGMTFKRATLFRKLPFVPQIIGFPRFSQFGNNLFSEYMQSMRGKVVRSYGYYSIRGDETQIPHKANALLGTFGVRAFREDPLFPVAGAEALRDDLVRKVEHTLSIQCRIGLLNALHIHDLRPRLLRLRLFTSSELCFFAKKSEGGKRVFGGMGRVAIRTALDPMAYLTRLSLSTPLARQDSAAHRGMPDLPSFCPALRHLTLRTLHAEHFIGLGINRLPHLAVLRVRKKANVPMSWLLSTRAIIVLLCDEKGLGIIPDAGACDHGMMLAFPRSLLGLGLDDVYGDGAVQNRVQDARVPASFCAVLFPRTFYERPSNGITNTPEKAMRACDARVAQKEAEWQMLLADTKT